MAEELSHRERTVLQYVVHDFIETATPVGSRYISRHHEGDLGLSSATIRNVLSDLEYMGYIDHPHTSAGRVPTDLGYRFYLDSLMQTEEVPESAQEQVLANLYAIDDSGGIIRESARLLSKISRQLCIVTSPHLSSGTFEKLELVQISSTRLMVIMSLKLGIVKTIMMEVGSETPRDRLDDLSRYLNERLSGLTLDQIRDTFQERFKDAQASDDTGLIRLFIDSVDKLFLPSNKEKLHIAGTKSIVDQPEFENPRNFRGIIELINDEEIIIHVLEKKLTGPRLTTVSIGEENQNQKLKDYSIISSVYNMGDLSGTIGVLGPKRMPYARMIPLVDYVARAISQMFSNNTYKA